MKVGDLLFTSGQLPLTSPASMPEGIEAQTEQVFDNLAAVLAEAGTSFDKVVKATVFVTDLGDFAKLNAIYAKRFGDHKPARSTVQVAALPRGAWSRSSSSPSSEAAGFAPFQRVNARSRILQHQALR